MDDEQRRKAMLELRDWCLEQRAIAVQSIKFWSSGEARIGTHKSGELMRNETPEHVEVLQRIVIDMDVLVAKIEKDFPQSD